MRVTKEMRKAASKRLGRAVSASQITNAMENAEDNNIKTEEDANKYLLELKGDWTSDKNEIDLVNIWLAVHKLVPVDVEHTFILNVKAPSDLSVEEIKNLVERLILNGQEEASASLECDDHDPDAELALELECSVKW